MSQRYGKPCGILSGKVKHSFTASAAVLHTYSCTIIRVGLHPAIPEIVSIACTLHDWLYCFKMLRVMHKAY